MDTSRYWRVLPFLAGVVLGIAGSGPADARENTRLEKLISLQATSAGQQAGLRGRVRTELRPDRGREKLNIQVESTNRALAGVQLDVLIINPNNRPDAVAVGVLVLVSNPQRPGEVRA